MKIGIVSDTHRNQKFLQSVTSWLLSKHHIIYLYHLGDDYEDANGIADQGIEVIQVPGIYDPKYKSGSVGAKQIEAVMGLRIMLVHSYDKDISVQDLDHADIILYGHTHEAEIKISDGKLLMNPGHLKSEMDKHFKPSFGLLEITEDSVHAKIFGVDFKEIHSVELLRSESGLYKR